MVWYLIYAAAAVALAVHFRGPNAVWGTATFGGLIGLVLAAVSADFGWWAIVQAAAIGSLIGVVFEWLPRLARRSAG